MRAAGPGGLAHCEPARGRGAEGPESEGGARLPEWKPLLPPLRRHSRAGRRGLDRGGSRGARRRRRHQAVRLEPCVRRRHAHTCPSPLPASPLAARSERARLNFPFILGPGGRGRRQRSFPRGLAGTRAARPDPKARPRAGCERARSPPPPPPPALLLAAASLGACHSVPPRAALVPGGASDGDPWAAPGERQKRNCKKVPNRILSPAVWSLTNNAVEVLGDSELLIVQFKAIMSNVSQNPVSIVDNVRSLRNLLSAQFYIVFPKQ